MATKNNILLDVAAISAPLVLVLGVRVLFSPSGAVANSGAAVAAVTPPPIAAAARKLSPEQQKAAEWIKSVGTLAGMRSPMAHPIAVPVAQVPVPEQEPEPAPTPAPTASPIAGLRLTGILGNSGGGLAAISGKVFKVGDVVRPGVTLKAIDAHRNSVTFGLDDGSEVTLVRKQDPIGN